MAPENKSKKRKSGASITSPSTKKLKKADAPAPADQPVAVKSSKKIKDAAPKADEASAVKSKSSRKRASDFFDGEEKQEKPAATTAAKKAKKTKKDEPAEESAPAAKAVKGKKRKTAEEPVPAEESAAEEEPAADEADEDNEPEDDQTAALLKGFDSDEDEQDGEDEGDIAKVPAIPDEKKLRKKLNKAKSESNDGPGVVYVGRIPHGFYEHQMRAYFSQFGEIRQLRLSRNKKTGRSKHYAFIQFENVEVARIVASTMDKYLMFGHILQVRLIPNDQVHPDLFKGANKRFKPAPRNKMQGRHLRLGMDREGWERRIEREEKRRKEKEEKLRAMDYEYDAPTVKSVSSVPKKSQEALPAPEEDEAPKALTEKAYEEEDKEEAAPAVEEKKATRRSKRISNGATEEKKEEEDKAAKAKKDTAKVTKSKKETPKKETPKKETAKKETPKKETAKKETPKKEAAKKDAAKPKTKKAKTSA